MTKKHINNLCGEEVTKRVGALADFCEIGTKLIESKEDGKTYIVDGNATYLVLTNEEADQMYHEYWVGVVDETRPIGFDTWIVKDILANNTDETFFDDLAYDHFAAYCDTLAQDKLEEKMDEVRIYDRYSYIKHLIAKNGGGLDFCIKTYGQDAAFEMAESHEAIDWDDVVESFKELGERGMVLAEWDLCENYIDMSEYYIYRTN